MVYQVPPAKRSIKQNVFEFTLPGDKKKYSLPKLAFIKPALVEKLDGGQKSEIVRALLDEYVPGVYDLMEDSYQLIALYEAWAAESGIKLGESSGSDGSSESTKSPSAETSSSPASASTT